MDELNQMKYICDKINSREINHSYIKTFVIQNDIKFTENMNGIFINLTLLDEHIIEDLYKYIYEYLHNFIKEDRETVLNNLKIENELIKKNKKIRKPLIKKQTQKYKIPPQLTDVEKNIIELSLTI